ncbi:MAG: 16S rRNA (uracil(1498)-N(3))-methyltransferase [Alphaproteobacteria bacterium]|nr:16S rRNA (uracil(1498)-N(3))-methyltransferase [Alphaproteobacteria bacterium]
MASDLKEAGGLTRLFVTVALEPGATVALNDGQAHYLLHVLRARAGDRVLVFNGRDGEWQAEIAMASKRAVTLKVGTRTVPQREVPDLWLVFAPVKKTPSDYLTQKATELGVARLQPVFTRRTIVTRINDERLLANAVEAAEQSARLSVPEIGAAVVLEKLLATWPQDRRIFFCDESGEARPLADAARDAGEGPAAILTGPEGGFDPAERERLRGLAFVTPVTLGPRVLRADTAALAALAIWQAVRGDWN